MDETTAAESKEEGREKVLNIIAYASFRTGHFVKQLIRLNKTLQNLKEGSASKEDIENIQLAIYHMEKDATKSIFTDFGAIYRSKVEELNQLNGDLDPDKELMEVVSTMVRPEDAWSRLFNLWMAAVVHKGHRFDLQTKGEILTQLSECYSKLAENETDPKRKIIFQLKSSAVWSFMVRYDLYQYE